MIEINNCSILLVKSIEIEINRFILIRRIKTKNKTKIKFNEI